MYCLVDSQAFDQRNKFGWNQYEFYLDPNKELPHMDMSTSLPP
jgi:hypothetical protein